MSDFLKFLLGSTCVVGLTGAILWVVRNAIATAVAQAGAREMERLRSELAKELELHKQSFAT